MFSYSEYKEIMNIIKRSGKQMTFREAFTKDCFIIMRHDVEFSVERAYNLACLENENHFYAAYFFQISNNSYNLFSQKNINMVKKIHDMGHEIGLHFHLSGLQKEEDIVSAIKNEMMIINTQFDFKIDSFSFHRPNPTVLGYNIKIPGLINAYQDDFFSFVSDWRTSVPEIKYLSDARHRWNYNLLPDKETLNSNNKIQILTHPYSWTQDGYDNLNNFRTLFTEKKQEILDTFDNECMHFKEIKNELYTLEYGLNRNSK